MCGFTSIYSKSGKPLCKETARKMSEDIFHRGPDDYGMYESTWCNVQCRRLSIIDVSRQGRQPMFDQSGNFLIAFNGELYNYKVLRKELTDAGIRFQSTSDTEVALYSYLKYGEACLKRFRGMFAMLIIDIRNREMFIARDHLGIKPLYYVETEDFIMLSSEIKAFRHAVPFALNEDALYEQLAFRYVSGHQTIFSGINEVEPGTSWLITPSRDARKSSYYDVSDSLNQRINITEEEVIGEIRNRLTDSINLHTASDVGYTVQLSGGVDSSFVAAVLAKELGHKIRTFSVSIKDDSSGYDFDEGVFQRQVAEQYSSDHNELVLGADDLNLELDRATWYMDVPIIHISCVFLMMLCRSAANQSKVMMTGEGADELFGGYSRYAKLEDNAYSPSGKTAKILKEVGLPAGILPDLPFLRGVKLQMTDKLINSQRILKRPVLESFLEGVTQNTDFRDSTIANIGSAAAQSYAHDQKCYLASLLHRQDRMSMAESVEARVPFCNPDLFDLINTLSPSIKTPTGITKHLLKVIAVGYLDEKIVYRKKNGFALPIDEWLRSGPFSERLSLLTDRVARNRGFYNMKFIEYAIKKLMAKEGSYGRYLASLIMFEVWMRMYIDNQARSPVPLVGK